MKNRMYSFFKRGFDIAASALGMLVTSPLWLIAAVGILISDPGPVFYVAHRIGINDREFPMFKFRSMRRGKADESVFRGEEDRIFGFGRFLRASKIDELPQLLNIFLGHMSVIGPRPAAPAQAAITRGGECAIASTVRPGLSGPAALYDYIYGDGVQDAEEYEQKVLPTRLALEVYYVEHRSVFYDIRMIWYTVVCVLAELFRKKPERILQELVSCAAVDEPETAAQPETANV